MTLETGLNFCQDFMAVIDTNCFEEKMKRLTGELSEMFKQSDRLQNEICEKPKAIGWEM